MTAAGIGLAAVRSLAAGASEAEDDRLMRLVRLLDGVAERGEADRVLGPVRARLGALRPARPLRFARLLFVPLDGAVAPAARWRRGGHEVPRSALAPLAAAVEAVLGPEAETIRRAAEGHAGAEEEAVAALGARLWPRAAEALPARPPPGWSEAGLTAEDLDAIRTVAGPVLASGEAIVAAAHAAAHGADTMRARVRAALAQVAEAGPLPLAAALATLLRRAAAPGAVAAAAAELGPGARAAAARILDAALEGEEVPPIEALDLRAAAGRMARFLGRAESMAGCGLLGPEGTRRLLAREREAVEACRRRLAAGAEAQVIAPLSALADADAVADEAVAEVEAAARGLRTLARIGRSAGDPGAQDRALRDLAERIAGLGHRAARPGGLTRMDLARAVEILVGPEAAEAVLHGARPRTPA